MHFRDLPIRRKLILMILFTSGLVLLLTCTAFLAYDFLAFRQTAVRQLSTLGEIVGANSTAALAFDNPNDAREILAALRAERHVVAAALYDASGRLFSRYPTDRPVGALPAMPGADGYRFEHSHLIGFGAVVERGNKRLGTLYLEADVGALYDRLRLYGAVALLVIAISLLVVYLVSRKLQQHISHPILALAETAQAISDRRDYSVRASKMGQDELGLLTDAFNHMLTRIDEQTRALTESEARVRAVLNSALSAVVVTDQDGTITDWNARAESMFGLARREALGLRFDETIIPPAHRQVHRQALGRALANDDAAVWHAPIEIDAQRRDGSAFPVELSVSPLKRDGIVTVCTFVTDVTDRREAEQRVHAQLARHHLLNRITRAIGERQELASIFHVLVRTLEDNMPVDFGCVCVYDAARELLSVAGLGVAGRPLAVALGLTERVDIPIDANGLARCVRGEFVYEPDAAAVAFPFPQRLAAQGLRSLVVAPLLVESQVFGALVAARRDANAFTSPDCEFLRQLSEHVALAAHQAQIYTALQQAYDDLRQSQQAVLQQERLRALGQMASGIAHDINNAISPVALYTQSLLEKEPNLSPRAREYLETIDRAIDDVAATVARMKEFYRHREPQLTLTPADLNAMVQQVLDLTRAWWSDLPQQRGVLVNTVTELTPDLPLIMGADSEIRDALTNLIFNAVDAMPDGGTLTIRTRLGDGTSEAKHPTHVFVEVSDTGLGMDEETRRRCLEPFFTTKGERGTGLGLAMVYGMVQRHSAEMEIESAVGRGTTVRLGFAVSIGVVDSASSGTPHIAPSRMRILIVDDDPLVLKSLRDTLESDGHVVHAAGGGQPGIDAFRAAREREEPFAVVITDLGMPNVDGRQVASAVKRASPSTPVILLTGWGQRMAAEGDVPPHVDRVLSKPPKLRDLNLALAHCRGLVQP